MDQMRAIWTALDDMMEKEPEKYKDFITSQLQAGQAYASTARPSSSHQVNADHLASLGSLAGLGMNPTPYGKGQEQEKFNQSVKHSSSKAGANLMKPTQAQKVVNLEGSKIDGTEDGGFELKLPAGICPTKINSTIQKGILIEEISSETFDESGVIEDSM